MATELRWQKHETVLVLVGVLDCDSLLSLWREQQQLLQQIETIDVSQLSRVDSAGLALLTYWIVNSPEQRAIQLVGMTERLKTLIVLYNLQSVIGVTH